jgi:hypothetical protein
MVRSNAGGPEMTEMSNIYEGMTRIVVDTPEHLEIQKLTEQVRDRVDKLEWMLDRAIEGLEEESGGGRTGVSKEEIREDLEAEWRNLRRAKAAPTNTSDQDSSPPTPSPLTPNS